jgi:CubicO group peptidase (beta-lactamase class C family)
MTDSSFEPQGALAERRVGMHRRGPGGALEAAEPLPIPPQLHGGGGLHSTAGDYLKFLRAVMAPDGGGVFGPQTLEGLREAQAHPGAAGELRSMAPPFSHDFRPMPGVPKSWTLGFLRNEADVPGGRRSGSLAWGGLANCYYWADPQSGVAGALFAQFFPFADPRMLATFGAFEAAVYSP